MKCDRKSLPDVKVRMAADLKRWLKAEAAKNHRTMSGEIVSMICARRANDQKRPAKSR